MPDTQDAIPSPAVPDTARDIGKLNEQIADLIPILYRTDASPQLSKLLNIVSRGKTLGREGYDHLVKFAKRLKQLRAFDDLYILTSEMNADGLASPVTRRLEVQALIELGVFETALDQVRPMLAGDVTDPDADKAHDACEAYGLLGRIYKQLFIEATRGQLDDDDGAEGEATAPSSDATTRRGKPAERETLQLYLMRSFKAYIHVWERVKTAYTTYQAINAVAIAHRAMRDRLAPPEDANEIKILAQEILDTIAKGKDVNVWAHATRGEALVAMERYAEAAIAYADYAQEPDITPFDLNASLRQLEEVWQLRGDEPIKGKPVRILKAALLAKMGAVGEANRATNTAPGALEAARVTMKVKEFRLLKADLAALPEPAEPAEVTAATDTSGDAGVSGKDAKALQKAFGINGPHGRKAIRRKMLLSSAVCRIEAMHLGDTRGVGTGFAIQGNLLHEAWGPGPVIVTNNHVVSSRGTMGAKRPEFASAVFVGEDDKDVAPVKFSSVLWESDVDAHDITILRPADDLPKGVVPLSELVEGALGPPAQNDEGIGRCYVIGFPNAGELSFSMADNILLDHDAPANCEVKHEEGRRVCVGVPAKPVRIHYRTPTVEGNSGSPVFDENRIALMAVHHSGHPQMERLNGKPGTYSANEGIWIDSIRQAIASSAASDSEASADMPRWWTFNETAPVKPAATDPGPLVLPRAPSGLSAFAGNPKPGISPFAPDLIYPPGPVRPKDRRAAQLETVIGVDNRTRVLDTQMTPWRMICAIRARWGSRLMVGTGCFIGPDAVLTAGHVVYSREFGKDAQYVEVIPGLNYARSGADRDASERRPYESAQVVSIHAHPQWKSGFSPRFDVAVIKVDRRLGDEVGWFGVEARTNDQLLDRWAHVTGYPGEMKEETPRGAGPQRAPVVAAQLWHHAAPIEKIELGRLFYKTDTTPGQSGAPVYVLSEAGQFMAPVVVGVHAYGVRSTPGAIGLANSGVLIDVDMLQKIREWSGR